jgi:type II secretory pathway pseudopilin PulG
LPELLVVLVILVVLTSILAPVFFTIKQSAKSVACLNNFHQAFTATNLYLADYDERYMPVNQQPATTPNSRNDRTWVQMLMPYVNTYGIFRCPEDNSDRPRREAMFDGDLVPGDTYSQYYTASLRTNLGFNFIYFSPIYQQGDNWVAQPKLESDVDYPSSTFLYIDSVWTLQEDGTPSGGGSWLVVPPCRFDEGGADTFKEGANAANVFTNDAEGWDVGKPMSPLQYGGTWPWHKGKTRMTTISADGTARSLTPRQIEDGCDVQPKWGGNIEDRSKYMWDLR